MIGGKPKSRQSLERAIAKYEAKRDRASNPSQRQYAASMLRMAQDALARSQDGEPSIEPDGDDVVTLHKDEYAAS